MNALNDILVAVQASALWPLIWSVLKIVFVILPLLGCVAYLTLWERKAIGWSQIRRARTASGPTAC